MNLKSNLKKVGGNQPMKSPRGNEQKINPNQIPSPTNMDPNTLISYNTRSNVAPPPGNFIIDYQID